MCFVVSCECVIESAGPVYGRCSYKEARVVVEMQCLLSFISRRTSSAKPFGSAALSGSVRDEIKRRVLQIDGPAWLCVVVSLLKFPNWTNLASVCISCLEPRSKVREVPF